MAFEIEATLPAALASANDRAAAFELPEASA
jgi:hypothetical protein